MPAGVIFEKGKEMQLSAKFTIGAEAANVINVGVQFIDWANGSEIGERVAVPFYLSDDANGDSIAASAASGGIAIGTDGVLIEWTADKAGIMVSESDGDVDIDITEVGIDTWYLILVMPDGRLVASGAITFA